MSRRASLLIGALLLVHLFLGIDSARRLTVTHDEYWHLPAGLLGWVQGRFDHDDLNPPLTRLWATWPSLLMKQPIAFDWEREPARGGGLRALGDALFVQNPGDRYVRLYTLARVANLCFSLATAVLLACWSRRLFGERAACLTVALWTCCPNVLAHAALVTPDMGAACMFVATLYAAWHYGQAPAWRRAGVYGLLLGLAQLTKFTSLLLYPLSLAVVLIARRTGSTREKQTRGLLWQLLAACALSVLVLNAGYLFRGTGRSLGSYRFQGGALASLSSLASPWRDVPVFLPSDYVQGIDHQQRTLQARHPVFLDGAWSGSGFGDYFVRALSYKLPHATQLLLALAVVCGLPLLRDRAFAWTRAMLWLPVLVLVGVASASGMQLGVRYILPAFPFLFLLAGECGRWLDWPQKRLRTALIGIVALAVPFALRHHPHHLAYFNELSGGPAGGRYHLLDSNLDWGQDLRELARWLDGRAIGALGLAYFGMVPPTGLGIDYYIPPPAPAPGWYAVSVNFVMGRPHTIRIPGSPEAPAGPTRSAAFNEFGWFRLFRPVDRIGYSIDVYHITVEDLRQDSLAFPTSLR